MPASPLSGRKLAGYEVGALVGAGGMGEVYRARDSKLNREVAIKILLPSVAGDADRLARLRREAQVLAALNHPNIAHIHGLEEADAGPFLVMEIVEGPTLADRIAQGRAAWSRNGRELFYQNREGMLTAVPILPPNTGGQFAAGLPTPILKTAYVLGRTTLGLDVRAYDVSPDGQRFLMLKDTDEAADAQPPRLAVTLNWGHALMARLPTP